MFNPKLVVWSALSVIVFLCAAMLTAWITRVDETLPFEPRHYKPLTHIQKFAVFIPKTLTELRSVIVEFYSSSAGDSLYFTVPGDMKATLLASSLRTDKDHPKEPCTARSESPEYGWSEANFYVTQPVVHFTTMRTTHGLEVGVFDLKSSSQPIHVVCQIEPLVQVHTFTKRTAAFDFIGTSEMAPLGNPYPRSPEEAEPPRPNPFEDYSQLQAGVTLVIAVEGENFSFDAGFKADDTARPEESRKLVGPTLVHVQWLDVYQEQFRDIILVVIGALIGIGATMLIEALRPLIDRAIERRDSSRAGKKVEQASEGPNAPA
jgi:hypothetical protein